jgi:hypothetical protein
VNKIATRTSDGENLWLRRRRGPLAGGTDIYRNSNRVYAQLVNFLVYHHQVEQCHSKNGSLRRQILVVTEGSRLILLRWRNPPWSGIARTLFVLGRSDMRCPPPDLSLQVGPPLAIPGIASSALLVPPFVHFLSFQRFRYDTCVYAPYAACK